MKDRQKPKYAYYGHRRCASAWTHNILANICQYLNLSWAYFEAGDEFQSKYLNSSKNGKIDFLFCNNVNSRYLEDVLNVLGFHVVRDPRDIWVSAYFSNFYAHELYENRPELTKNRSELRKINSIDEGLFSVLEFLSFEWDDLKSWELNNPSILEIKFEELVFEPVNNFIKILNHLQLLEEDNISISRATKNNIIYLLNNYSKSVFGFYPFSPYRKSNRITMDRLLYILHNHSYENYSGGRKRGQENIYNDYRSGLIGDWKKYLNSKHKEVFKQEYGDLLIKYGYENDNNW